MTSKKVSSPEIAGPVIDDLCRDSCRILEAFGDLQSSVIRECARILHRPYEHIGLVGIVKYDLPKDLWETDFERLCPYLQRYGNKLLCTNDEVVQEYLKADSATATG